MSRTTKTVLITGAGSGIGRDAAFALARRGHHVIATTLTEVQAVELKALAGRDGLSVETYKLDITLPEDRQSIIRHNIDVLINNAGVGESGPLSEVPLQLVKNNFEVNVFSTLAMVQIALKEMVRKKKGTVLVISSLAGRKPMPFLGPYSMTKYALSGGVAALRQEMKWVSPDIHISLIEPGAYATGFNQRMFATKYSWMNQDSYFHGVMPQIEKEYKHWFDIIEQKSTKSIVRVIVKATESDNPKLRYVAPWLQGFGVFILRMMGK